MVWKTGKSYDTACTMFNMHNKISCQVQSLFYTCITSSVTIFLLQWYHPVRHLHLHVLCHHHHHHFFFFIVFIIESGFINNTSINKMLTLVRETRMRMCTSMHTRTRALSYAHMNAGVYTRIYTHMHTLACAFKIHTSMHMDCV
jgi:hypothetical protein